MQFIDRSQKFGIEASFYADNTRLPLVTLRNENGPMLSQNFITGITLSKRLSLNHLMSLTATYESQHLDPDFLTTTGIRKLSYDYLKFAFTYQANTLDYKHFPRHGVSYFLSASTSDLLRGSIKTDTGRDQFKPGDESSFSFNRFYTARAWLREYSPLSETVTLSFGGEILLSTSVDSVTSNNNLFFLGGTESVTERSIPCTGFHANQIPIQSLAGLRIGTDIRIATDLHLTFDGNLFALQEPDRESGFSLLGGYGAGLAYMTIAGPIRIGIMHGIYDRELLFRPVKGYVSIGFTF
jgi:hypothetical protein